MTVGDFKPYVWIGGPNRGLAFMADNDRGWVPDDEKKVAYTPFWAGKHNTALDFEFAEAPQRKDGVDCVDASSDKELRRSRVEIIESTAARVHVRWTAKPCDLNYKVWGESVAEDFYF